jgi:ADP-heptose:LPS heptosyltransferase
MIFFYQQSEKEMHLNVQLSAYKTLKIKNIVKDKQPNLEEIYILPAKNFNNHLEFLNNHHPEIKLFRVPTEVIEKTINLPCMIGSKEEAGSEMFRNDLDTLEVLEVLHKEKKRKLSVALYTENRFVLGDSLIQATVIKDLYNQARAKGIDLEIVMFQQLSAMHSSQFYQNVFPEIKVKYFPISINDFFYSDLILTDSSYANVFDMDLHDAFAKQLNFKLSPDFSVENSYNPDIHIKNKAKTIYKEIFGNDLPVVVFNKESSSKLRSMPNEVAEELINKLLKKEKFNIVTFDRVSFLNISHPNYKVMSYYTEELESYLAFLAASDGLISVDSGPVHSAARLGVPSFSFYTSIDPNIREAHYENADSVFLENEYKNLHHKEDLEEEEYLKIWDEIRNNDEIVKRIVKKFKKGFF